jgi:hypothetical protein
VPADEAAGEGEETFVDVGAAVVADEEASASVEPGEGAFDDPAVLSEAGAVLGLAAGDLGLDAAFAQLLAMPLGVVGAVGEQPVGAAARVADTAAHRRHPVDKRQQLGDVVAVTAGQRPRQRKAAAVC